MEVLFGMKGKTLCYILAAAGLFLLASCASGKKKALSELNLAGDFELRARYAASDTETAIESHGPWRGWDFLAEKLIAGGIPETQVKDVLLDPRMPAFTFVPFKLKPRESSIMYEQFTAPSKLKVAREFLDKNTKYFDDAEKTFHVNRYTVAAIHLIETGCGRNTGREIVLNRLARVSSAGESKNLQRNFEELKKTDPAVTIEQVKSRAQYLEETFFPEVMALFKMAQLNGVDILGLKGSIAGAFGLSQFMPSAYLTKGVDGDKDGTISLFSAPDSILSTANYLASHGWKDTASYADKMAALWKYNRSEAYGRAVLKVGILLKALDKPASRFGRV